MNGPIQKMLVHIDGTEASILAAQYAICLSRRYDAELTALYVINTRALSDLLKAHIFIESEQEEYQHDLELDADRYLKHVRDLAREKGVAVETLSRSGTIHQEIKNCIKENEIDLLVLGEISHARSRRDELCNESEMALRRSPCPVLTVKDEERVWELYDALV